MAIFHGPSGIIYGLWVEDHETKVDKVEGDDQVVIRREYRDVMGGKIKQSVKLHKSMLKGLIEELQGFLEDPASTVEDIREDIDLSIEELWREHMTARDRKDPDHVCHGIIEGLKRARQATGEPWEPPGGFPDES